MSEAKVTTSDAIDPAADIEPVVYLTPSDAIGHKYWLMLKQISENMHQELWDQLTAANNLDRTNQAYTIRILKGNLAVFKIDADGEIIE